MDDATGGYRNRDSYAQRWLVGLSAIGILLADVMLVNTAARFNDWLAPAFSSPWNWCGKLASITFSLLLLLMSPWLRENSGIRWRQARGSLRLSTGCFVAFGLFATGIGFLNKPRPFSVDTFLFQFTMPALDEELLIRGIMLSLFERAFGQNPMSCQLRFGFASVLTTLFFALPHAISFSAGRIEFSSIVFVTTAIIAALLALIRTRSGSLVWPILCHSVWNGTIFLVTMLR